jgi:hypothetical protein
MTQSRRIALLILLVAVIGLVVAVSTTAGRGLPVFNPGYNNEIPVSTDGATYGPDVVCGDTDLANPAQDPVCPTPAGTPVVDPSSDTTNDAGG